MSPHSDTDTAILTVKVGTQVLGPRAVSLGDLHGGDVHPIQLELGPVPVLDDDQVTIYYQIINNGNGRDVGPIVAAVGGVVKAAAPIAGGINPIAGQIVTALGTLAGDVGGAISSVWNFTSCDKVLINETLGTEGSVILREYGARSFSTVVNTYDVSGPSGLNLCNAHARYDLSFSILPSYVRIDNVNSGLSMDVRGGSVDDGALLQQFTTHNGPDQRWHLVPTNGVEKPNSVAIVSVNSGKALDVPSGSHDSNVLIQQYTLHGGSNQRWQFVASTDGQSVEILNDESGLALDVPNGSTTPGTPIQQYTPHGGPNQQWRIVVDPVEPAL